MPITFEDVSASIEAPPPAADAAPQAPPRQPDDELPLRLEQALRLRAERLARLSAD
jgi:hypothetical protein